MGTISVSIVLVDDIRSILVFSGLENLSMELEVTRWMQTHHKFSGLNLIIWYCSSVCHTIVFAQRVCFIVDLQWIWATNLWPLFQLGRILHGIFLQQHQPKKERSICDLATVHYHILNINLIIITNNTRVLFLVSWLRPMGSMYGTWQCTLTILFYILYCIIRFVILWKAEKDSCKLGIKCNFW